jgi:hypothetical protein
MRPSIRCAPKRLTLLVLRYARSLAREHCIRPLSRSRTWWIADSITSPLLGITDSADAAGAAGAADAAGIADGSDDTLPSGAEVTVTLATESGVRTEVSLRPCQQSCVTTARQDLLATGGPSDGARYRTSDGAVLPTKSVGLSVGGRDSVGASDTGSNGDCDGGSDGLSDGGGEGVGVSLGCAETCVNTRTHAQHTGLPGLHND